MTAAQLTASSLNSPQAEPTAVRLPRPSEIDVTCAKEEKDVWICYPQDLFCQQNIDQVPQCSTYVLCVTQVQAQTSYLFCFLRCRHQATCQLFGINTGRQPKVKPESLGTFRKWLRRDWVPNGPNLPPFTSWKDQGRSRLHCSAWRAGNSWKF